MRFIKPLLFSIALLLVVELSFRVFLFGANSLNPLRMNSYTQIHDSGLTRTASIPEVYYELRPDADEWYKGTRFTTNSAGQRDQSYELTKPANTFRVAVLGSSWTMGSGAKIDDVWHSVIEESLNSDSASLQYEFINFGVDQYGLGEIVATLEHKVAAYNPDLVLIAITHYTPTVLWPQPPVKYVEQSRRNPFFDYYTLRAIDLQFGLGIYSDSDTRRPSVGADGEFSRQLNEAFDRFVAFSQTTDTPVAIVRLAYSGAWKIKGKAPGNAFASVDDSLTYFEILEELRSHGYKPRQLRISNWDSHPNPLAHRLMAEAVRNGMVANKLLPADQNTTAQ